MLEGGSVVEKQMPGGHDNKKGKAMVEAGLSAAVEMTDFFRAEACVL
jgi:hypothetical protein